MPLIQKPTPFDDREWIYEIKYDGFRALVLVEEGHCRFLSRNKHKLPGFRELRYALARDIYAKNAVIDGELAVADHLGRPVFADMMRHRRLAQYFAFDLLWLDGEDLRDMPLLERKQRLKRILPERSIHVLYVDHVQGAGRRLYQAACDLDLEGIVAKRADSRYEPEAGEGNWIKIKNPRYSQKEGRGDLYKRSA